MILKGIKKTFFNTKKAFGYLAPSDNFVPLCNSLTAEAVAWVCITVYVLRNYSANISDLVRTQTQRHFQHSPAHHIPAPRILHQVAQNRLGNQEETGNT